MKTLILAIVVALSTLAAKAEAGSYWINASSCVLDPGSVSKSVSSAGTIKHGTGQTGNIALYCPVPSDLGFSPVYLGMLYSATGNSGSDYIAAAINRMNVSTGGLSNDSAMWNTSSSGSVVFQSKTIGVTWDPTSYAYWVRIDIGRSSATQILYAIKLYN